MPSSVTSRRRPRAAETPAERPDRPLGGSGMVAAVQALVLSLAVVILPAVLAVLASSSGEGWGSAVPVALAIWLLGNGVPISAGGVTITLVPAGLTVLCLFACYASARRSGRADVSCWTTATATYAAGTFAVAFASGRVTGLGLLAAPLCGILVGGLGTGLGLVTRRDAPPLGELTARLDRWLPPVLRLGLRGALVAAACLMAVAGLLVGVWVIGGRSTSWDIARGLDAGTIGGLVLAIAQLTLVPNLVIWASAWIAGPGFDVGVATHLSAQGTTSGVLPAVPLLGALPGPGWSNVAAMCAPVVVVACGALAGEFAWRRLGVVLGRDLASERPSWAELAWCGGGIVVGSGVIVGLLAWWSGGAVGAQGLSRIGADAVWAGLAVAGEALVGAAAVLVVHRSLAGRAAAAA